MWPKTKSSKVSHHYHCPECSQDCDNIKGCAIHYVPCGMCVTHGNSRTMVQTSKCVKIRTGRAAYWPNGQHHVRDTAPWKGKLQQNFHWTSVNVCDSCDAMLKYHYRRKR